MAEPIRLSASGISSYDAKKAASAVEQAVNYLQQVKLDIDFKDSFSGMSMFPNTQGELRSVLSTLEKKKETIDALVTALSNGTQKIEDADAGFKHDLIEETLGEKLLKAVKTAGEILLYQQFGSLFGIFAISGKYKDTAVVKWIDDTVEEVPDEIKDVTKDIIGGTTYNAIDAGWDVVKGDYSWDTLESFLKALEADGSTIVKTLKLIAQPEGTMKNLMDGATESVDEASQHLLEGDIPGVLLSFGKGFGCWAGAFGYGVAEVTTELIGDAVTGALDTMMLPIKLVRHYIPSETEGALLKPGGVLGNLVVDAAEKYAPDATYEVRGFLDHLSEKYDRGSQAIGDWISDLL